MGFWDTALSVSGGGLFSKKVRKGVKNAVFGTKDKNTQLKNTTPEQEEINRLITEGLTKGEGPLADIFGGFNEEDFNKGVTAPALKNFQDNVLPMLQEKFIAGNQVGGSGMQNAGIKAGVDLQSQLAKLMYEAKQQQKQNKIAGVNTLQSQKNVENIYKEGDPGLLQGISKQALPIAAKAIAG